MPRAALDADLHVFVEKPVVGSWTEALKLEERVSSHRRVVFVGHNMRREAGIRFVKERYDRGELGDPVSFRICLSHGGAFHWKDAYWRTRKDLCREGPLRVNGVHASDVLEYLFGPIEEVHASLSVRLDAQRAPDSGSALVRVGPAAGVISTSWVIPSLNRFQFEFTEALVDYDLERLFLRLGRDVRCKPAPDRLVKLLRIDSRREQLEEFARCLRGDARPETGWREGVRAVMFFEACYRSHVENRPIRLQELPCTI